MLTFKCGCFQCQKKNMTLEQRLEEFYQCENLEEENPEETASVKMSGAL